MPPWSAWGCSSSSCLLPVGSSSGRAPASAPPVDLRWRRGRQLVERDEFPLRRAEDGVPDPRPARGSRRDGAVELGAAKQRALLAVLLLHANELVSTSRLVEAVWGERPPATAEKLVQGYVHALRKRLGADDHRDARARLQARRRRERPRPAGVRAADRRGARSAAAGGGRASAAGALAVAWATAGGRRHRRVRGGRAGPSRRAPSEHAARADRGRARARPPCGDRRRARVARRGAPVPGAGARAPHAQPLPLGTAGGRAGGLPGASPEARRRARAPAEPGAARPRGGDPPAGRGSRTPRADDGVVAPPSPVEAPGERLSGTPRAALADLAFVAAAASVLVLVGAAVAVAVLRDEPATVAVAPNSVAVIDPEQNRVVDSVEVGIRPGPVAAGAGPVWVANVEDQTLARIAPNGTRPEVRLAPGDADGRRGRLRRRLGRARPPRPALQGRSDLRARDGDDRRHEDRVRDLDGHRRGRLRCGLGRATAIRRSHASTRGRSERTGATFAGVRPVGVAVGAGSVWVANGGEPTVERFNPATFEEGPIGRRSPSATGRRDRVRGGSGLGGERRRRHRQPDRPEGHSVRSIPVGDEPAAVAVGAGAVWVANAGDGTVWRIDPVTYEVETIDVGGAPAGIAVAGGRVWVTVQEP